MSLDFSKFATRQQPTDAECRAMSACSLIHAGAIFTTVSAANDVRAENAAAREILRRLNEWELDHASEVAK